MAFALMGDTDRAWDLFTLLNPIHHGATPGQVAVCKVEPYVMAADIYAVPPHTGRGGWTWYTGSAGWMYRLLLETLLGVNLEGNQLRLTPSLPKSWSTFTLHYRYGQTHYHIRIARLPAVPAGGGRLSLDGQALAGNIVSLLDDHRDHSVEMQMGETELLPDRP
jgi:cellobiose phosphorylase